MEREWIARYQEGFITASGEQVNLGERLSVNHGWESPEAAQRFWTERGDFDDPTVASYGNGKQQLEDVRFREEFATLGVVKIWRRITFQPTRSAPRPLQKDARI